MDSDRRGKGTTQNTERQEDSPSALMLGMCLPRGLAHHTMPHSLRRKLRCHDISDSMCAALRDFRMPVSWFTREQNGLAVVTPLTGMVCTW